MKNHSFIDRILGLLPEMVLYQFGYSNLPKNVGRDVITWPKRTELAIKLLSELNLGDFGISIADYGCGKQEIKKLISKNWLYIPYDIYPHTTDTRVINLDTESPKDKYTIIIALGLLEYLQDPLTFLSYLINCSSFFMFSYNFPRENYKRVINGWKNSLSFDVINISLSTQNSMLIHSETIIDNEWLFLCKGLVEF